MRSYGVIVGCCGAGDVVTGDCADVFGVIGTGVGACVGATLSCATGRGVAFDGNATTLLSVGFGVAFSTGSGGGTTLGTLVVTGGFVVATGFVSATGTDGFSEATGAFGCPM
jgi:hypothetical protein